MPVFLLLSSDASLQAELESSLGGIHPKPTLIQAGSWSEVDSCLSSLRDVEALLVDAENFDPPQSFPSPILLLGGSQKDQEMYPNLSRPFYTDSLAFTLENLLQNPCPSSDNQHEHRAQLDFLTSLIREVVHDLNNQMTTLRGNIPLLQELYPEESETFTDMEQATDRAASLLHLLEAVDPDTLTTPKTFPLDTLLKDFTHFAKKMYPGSFSSEIPVSILHQSIQGDLSLLCNLLLQILWLYSPDFPELQIKAQLEEKTIKIYFTPNHPVKDEGTIQDHLKRLQTKHHSGDVKLGLEKESVCFSLPRV